MFFQVPVIKQSSLKMNLWAESAAVLYPTAWLVKAPGWHSTSTSLLKKANGTALFEDITPKLEMTSPSAGSE